MLSGGRLWGRQANVNSPASGSGPLITAGWHTLARVWDGRVRDQAREDRRYSWSCKTGCEASLLGEGMARVEIFRGQARRRRSEAERRRPVAETFWRLGCNRGSAFAQCCNAASALVPRPGRLT